MKDISNKKFNKQLNIPYFRKNYIECMDKYWSCFINKEDSYPCLYLNFLKEGSYWYLICEPDFESLGLCSNNNLYDQIDKQIRKFINQFKIYTNTIPVHINLTLSDNLDTSVHANTCILDISKNHLWIFEPMGSTLNYKSNFYVKYTRFWKDISILLEFKYKGFFLTECPFQTLDNLCYLWTSWVEVICLKNRKKSITHLQHFFLKKYLLPHREYLNQFGNYLLDIL